MLRNVRALPSVFVLATALSAAACQSPTSTDTSLDVNDFVDSSASAQPVAAEASTGKTYRVVRGNNQPDDILEYDWTATFAVTLTLNSNSTSKDVDLAFPVSITSASVKVQQASGGIVTPPTGTDAEHYESIITQSTGNSFSAANSSVSMTFQVWYDLPSQGKEALATVTVSFKDDDGTTFSKNVTVQIN